MSGVIFKISAGFLVSALALVAGALYLSKHYNEEQRRLAVAGDMRGATQVAERAVRLDPFDPDPLVAQSFLLRQRNLDQEAAESLRQAIERDPNNFMPYLMLGNLQSENLNDLDAAVKSYRKGLELNPRAAVARSGLAQTLIRQDRLEEAKKEYEKLKEQKEISYFGLYDLGRIYVRTGEPEEGYKTIKMAKRRASRSLEDASGGLKSQREQLIAAMDLAMADALVVQRRYDAAHKVIDASSSEQAPALLELLNADPEAYRESVVNSEIY